MPATSNQPPGEMWTFHGVTSPNTTQVPDQYLDELLPVLTGAELKVLLYITRRTFGFKKEADNISLSQMLSGITTTDGRVLDHGVGLTKKTLLQAINSLEAKQIILTERRQSAERGFEPTCYRLNIAAPSEKTAMAPPMGEKVPQGGGVKRTPSPRGKNDAIQQTAKQQTEITYLRKDETSGIDGEGEEHQPYHTVSDRMPTGSSTPFDRDPDTLAPPDVVAEQGSDERPLATMLARRAPKRDASREDRAAIAATIGRFAGELGDATPKSSVTRAINLFQQSNLSRDRFLDLLFQARATTRGKRGRMGYFFGVLEKWFAQQAVT